MKTLIITITTTLISIPPHTIQPYNPQHCLHVWLNPLTLTLDPNPDPTPDRVERAEEHLEGRIAALEVGLG